MNADHKNEIVERAFFVNVSEKISYTIKVHATSKAQAKKKLLEQLNDGGYCVEDFEGGDAPTKSNFKANFIHEVS